jgi:hypothetical protein
VVVFLLIAAAAALQTATAQLELQLGSINNLINNLSNSK